MTTITKERRAHLIREWAKRINAIEAAHADLRQLTQASLESPLIDAGLRIADAYTHATSELVGDTNEWLTWYWLENEMGAKALAAGAGPDSGIAPIRTVEHLITLIEECLE